MMRITDFFRHFTFQKLLMALGALLMMWLLFVGTVVTWRYAKDTCHKIYYNYLYRADAGNADKRQWTDMGAAKMHFEYKYGKGKIVDGHSGKTLVDNVDWVAPPTGNTDGIYCFAQGEYRGYIDSYTGKVVVKADKYVKAWAMTEDRAVVVADDGMVRFIDNTGKEIVNTGMKYRETPHACIFKSGLCPLLADNGKYLLLDKEGNKITEPIYDDVHHIGDGFWVALKDSQYSVIHPEKQEKVGPA